MSRKSPGPARWPGRPSAARASSSGAPGCPRRVRRAHEAPLHGRRVLARAPGGFGLREQQLAGELWISLAEHGQRAQRAIVVRDRVLVGHVRVRLLPGDAAEVHGAVGRAVRGAERVVIGDLSHVGAGSGERRGLERFGHLAVQADALGAR